jgi:diaminohydroxyphosphoribosylaminopyrimidine deaminase/5-amino-6-(5-phosphoribosylamino)uracil reductase
MDPGEPVRQPLRVVLDSHLRMPPTARMLALPGRTLVLYTGERPATAATLSEAGAELAQVSAARGRVDLGAALSRLAEHEINEVLLEAGPTLAGAAMARGLIDELIVYLAPHVMGDGARGLLHLPGLECMEQRLGLEIIDVRAVGPDWRITARPAG